MKEYQIVLANFFTEEKKFAIIRAEDQSEIEEKATVLGRRNPEFVIVAYLEGEEKVSLRPHQMMKEKEKISSEDTSAVVEFLARWRVIFGGFQIMPDYSLPKDFAVFRRAVRRKFEPVQSSKPVRRTSKGQRAPRVEIFQGAAGL